MPTATKENTVEVTPAELRELANTLEHSAQNPNGDVLIWFNDKILFKYSKILSVDARKGRAYGEEIHS